MTDQDKRILAQALLVFGVVVSSLNEGLQVALQLTVVPALILLLLKCYNRQIVLLHEVLTTINCGLSLSIGGFFFSKGLITGDFILFLAGSAVMIAGMVFWGVTVLIPNYFHK